MKIPVLLSYYFFKTDKRGEMFSYMKKHKEDFRVIIDSGAYSAFTRQRPIDVDEYSRWVRDELLKELPWVDGYFQLDVVGDQKKTRDNLRASERLGIHPIPIFTRAETEQELSFLNDVLLRDYEWVGVGAIRSYQKAYTKWVLEKCKDTSKLHLLGVTDRNFISHYHPRSCDSMSWYVGNMRGAFTNPKTMRIFPAEQRFTLREVQEFGFMEKDWSKVNDAAYRSQDQKLMTAGQATCSHAWLRLVQRSLPTTTIYLAAVSRTPLQSVRRSYRYFLEHRAIDLFTFSEEEEE